VPLVEALLQQFFQAWYHKPYKQPHAASAKLISSLYILPSRVPPANPASLSNIVSAKLMSVSDTGFAFDGVTCRRSAPQFTQN